MGNMTGGFILERIVAHIVRATVDSLYQLIQIIVKNTFKMSTSS